MQGLEKAYEKMLEFKKQKRVNLSLFKTIRL